MFKQLTGKQALSQSLLSAILVCLTIFFLAGCNSNYTLQGSTTNGNGHQGQGSGSTGSTGGSTGGSGSSTGSGSGSTGSTGGSTSSGPFQVTSIDMSVDPTRLAGHPCGSQLTVTYTATFHLAPNGPGGTIQFQYSTDDYHTFTPASVTVDPGQTTATYQFSATGLIHVTQYPDVFPGQGGVRVTSPNPASPTLEGAVTGQCL